MALKVKKKTLADKINALITTTPVTFGSDDEAEDTKAKVVDYEEDTDSDNNVGQSRIRKQNLETLDQTDSRYAGKKVSRKDIYEDSSREESDESMKGEESDEDDGDEDGNIEDKEDESEDEKDMTDNGSEMDTYESDKEISSDKGIDKSEESEEDDEDEDDYGFDIGNPLLRNRDDTSKIKTMSDTNLKADIDKGNCVRSQLKLWENLLEMRIKLQKCLLTSNQMPQYDTYKDYRTQPEFMKTTSEAKSKLTVLLNNLLELQSSLLKQYPETRNLNTTSKKRKASESAEEAEEDSMNEEIPSDTEEEAEDEPACEEEDKGESQGTPKSKQETPRKKMKLSDYEKVLQEHHKQYASYRDSVIQKWNEKTRIATGTMNKGMIQTTLKQIEFALTDKPKLRKRTQLKRSEYKVVGKPEAAEDEDARRTQEYDPEIYDDDDFYHQLLRDLIEYKSSDVTDPIQLSKQWIQLQNMRSKMKRKVDTRASKGRKIRYNVHNKLVNFMAPITVNDTWTEHAKNELYNSLFGKIKPVEEVVR